MTRQRGKTFPFPKHRTFVLDIIRAARTVPAFPVDMWFELGSVAQARSATQIRISWTAVFLRGWGLVSARFPSLRHCYLRFPWQRIYEHPYSVGSVSVHRREPGAATDALIWCRVPHPEHRTLPEIQQRLNNVQHGPFNRVFRDERRIAAIPWPLRHLMWDVVTQAWGWGKSQRLGTFSISSLAGQDAMNRQHPLILTSSLSYSAVDARDGRCLVTLLCDHRVLDGYMAAESLHALHDTLRTQVLDELHGLAAPTSESEAA